MPYQKSVQEVVKLYQSDTVRGLSEEEARRRYDQLGANRLQEEAPETNVSRLLRQLSDPLIVILLIAAIISLLLREITDAVVIISVVLLNSIIGVRQEAKAEQSLAALKELSAPIATVLRNGTTYQLAAAQLTLGDVVILTAGCFIPADLRLITSYNLQIEESALTGESQPSIKDAELCMRDTVPIADRHNMAYLGTYVAEGRGTGIVVAIASQSEMGRIASLLQKKKQLTPLQYRLQKLSQLLGALAVGVCLIIFAISLYQGKPFLEMLLTAISLAVAVIPEGLPAVVTISLAIGVMRMSKAQAIVRQLPAVETLGSVSVICSDKTGTLTENRMKVVNSYLNGIDDLSLPSATERQLFLEGLLLCNDCNYENGEYHGSPTERALAEYASLFHYQKPETDQKKPRITEIAFSSKRKRMTTIHKVDYRYLVYTKGAAEVILPLCTGIQEKGTVVPFDRLKKEAVLKQVERYATKALRVIALAYRYRYDEKVEHAEENLVFLGLAGLIDPPRREVQNAIQVAHLAQIQTVMITGDHPETALAIAQQLSLAQSTKEVITGQELNDLSAEQLAMTIDRYRVFARVTPEHKVKIIEAYQQKGIVTAMTGDGVNDAPALRRADIGIAMGSGTDVSKQAADLILVDNNFATIIKAVEEGRNIYLNIQKAILYLLSCNLGEMSVLLLAITLMNDSIVPLSAIQILWVNLMTDAFPALALSKEPHDPYVMRKAPHPQKQLFSRGNIPFLFLNGFYIGTISLVAFRYGLETGELTASTMCLMVLSLSQLFHSLNFRSMDHSIFRVGILKNRYLILVFFLSIAIQVTLTLFSSTCVALNITALSYAQWGVVFGLSVSVILVNELSKII